MRWPRRILRIGLPAIIAIFLSVIFIYIPRQDHNRIEKQTDSMRALSRNVSRTSNLINSADGGIVPGSTGTAQALAENFNDTAKSIPAANMTPASKLLALPWDKETTGYNSSISNPKYRLAINSLPSQIKSARDYLYYQADVWTDLAKLIEYDPGQDLSDQSTAASRQSAAAQGILAISSTLKSVTKYNDPYVNQLTNLVELAATAAANDSAGQFIADITDIQNRIIANRARFTLDAQNSLKRELARSQNQLLATISQIQKA